MQRTGRLNAGDWRLTGAFTLAGVRGAVTLAGVLTLPLTMNNGSPFPARAIAVFLAAGVIVLSLALATVGLPMLLRGIVVPPDASAQDDEGAARAAAARAALAALQRAVRDISTGHEDADVPVHVASRLMDDYQSRIARASTGGDGREAVDRAARIERKLRMVALDAERGEIFRRMRAHEIGSAVGRQLVRELDLLEARLRV